MTNSDNNRDFGNGLICGMVSACIIWILIVEYILIPSRVETQAQLENQAIEHGYGKIIIRDGKRTFSWIDKLEDNQTERK